MTEYKSPFYVVEEFLSPKQCEKIVNSLDFIVPDTDIKHNPIRMDRYNDDLQGEIFKQLQTLVPQLEQYYDFKYKGTEVMTFQWYPEGFKTPELISENSSYIRKSWVRTKARDLTGIIFLSDSNETTPFDTEYECYGGKLEFPQYGFGFHPQRGQLVIYPSGPHFINATARVQAGDLYQVKFHIASQMPYLYDPEKFPGDFTKWF